jgi:hypothetical protein
MELWREADYRKKSVPQLILMGELERLVSKSICGRFYRSNERRANDFHRLRILRESIIKF